MYFESRWEQLASRYSNLKQFIAGAWGACYERESKSRRYHPLFEAAS